MLDVPRPSTEELIFSSRVLTRAAVWFSLGLAAAPVLDVVDDGGLVVAVIQCDTVSIARASSIILLFVSIASAAGWLFVRLRPSDRLWFFGVCGSMVTAYVLHTGLGFSGLVSLVSLLLAGSCLRGRAGVLSGTAKNAQRPPPPPTGC
jgi:hypothetical protein